MFNKYIFLPVDILMECLYSVVVIWLPLNHAHSVGISDLWLICFLRPRNNYWNTYILQPNGCLSTMYILVSCDCLRPPHTSSVVFCPCTFCGHVTASSLVLVSGHVTDHTANIVEQGSGSFWEKTGNIFSSWILLKQRLLKWSYFVCKKSWVSRLNPVCSHA